MGAFEIVRPFRDMESIKIEFGMVVKGLTALDATIADDGTINLSLNGLGNLSVTKDTCAWYPLLRAATVAFNYEARLVTVERVNKKNIYTVTRNGVLMGVVVGDTYHKIQKISVKDGYSFSLPGWLSVDEPEKGVFLGHVLDGRDFPDVENVWCKV